MSEIVRLDKEEFRLNWTNYIILGKVFIRAMNIIRVKGHQKEIKGHSRCIENTQSMAEFDFLHSAGGFHQDTPYVEL